ncbi:MAG: DUF4271 domain-containing protein [Prevotella sp.]|uniref:DUF4271 domain-containing protein n=1 Tax=Prevotella sp. TaxID=59823 RepID=UPI002A279569|nr:DUF4271 domain-containing protein [Prevotella sp.]MDD7317278.1 DUF4271 domain-containing protein [Prevotellaceae bacterium]MDY4019882.1 DUF4271 domain-containing protein [Prevotella sp.]
MKGMLLRADSLHNARQSAVAEPSAGHWEGHNTDGTAAGLTPKQVLQQLPKDATPAQQDSAIQANFSPTREHLSTRPDTLRMPFDSVKTSKDAKPFFEESFFDRDSMYHPELSGGLYGVAGDPVPYNMRGDTLITCLLLACFILGIISFSHSRNLISRQAKNFFRFSSGNTTTENETTSELRFQLFLVFVTCLQFSLLAFFYVEETVSEPLILKSHYTLIAIFLALSSGYYLFKTAAYTFVSGVFFNMASNRLWLKSQLFVISILGVVLFPAVVLLIYFNLPLHTVLIYTTALVVLAKILSFYKCYVTFFRNNSPGLQIFLYFCTLEIVPLLALVGGMMMIVDSLKINY